MWAKNWGVNLELPKHDAFVINAYGRSQNVWLKNSYSQIRQYISEKKLLYIIYCGLMLHLLKRVEQLAWLIIRGKLWTLKKSTSRIYPYYFYLQANTFYLFNFDRCLLAAEHEYKQKYFFVKIFMFYKTHFHLKFKY